MGPMVGGAMVAWVTAPGQQRPLAQVYPLGHWFVPLQLDPISGAAPLGHSGTGAQGVLAKPSEIDDGIQFSEGGYWENRIGVNFLRSFVSVRRPLGFWLSEGL